jgi:leucyl-tRNA synthetase
VRGYLMFAFKWDLGGPWDSQGILGVVRFLNDVWNLIVKPLPASKGKAGEGDVRALRRKTHQTIMRVTDDIEDFAFNTAMAALMELKNTMQAARTTPVAHTEAWDEAIRSLLLMLAPFTPHIVEELWARTGGEYSIHQQAWPEADPEIAAEEIITLIVQVNGKVRDRIEVPADIDEAAAKEAALASERVQSYLDGGEPRKVIYVPGRLVNVVK